MKAEELRRSILQLAIQGKLVAQDPNEEPSSILLKRIIQEKQELIKQGKIKDKMMNSFIYKGSDNSFYEKIGNTELCIDDDVPFDIPNSWAWTRLNSISSVCGGFAFKSNLYSDKGIRVIRISDFDENGFKDNKIVRYPKIDGLESYMIEINNILMAMTGGTVGKSLFVKEIKEPLLVNQRVACIKVSDNISSEYINAVIKSFYILNIVNSKKNSTNDNISMDNINSFLIPLPPLNEQRRIVKRIIEFESLIELYNKLEFEESKLVEELPVKLRNSILQYAIQGKLIDQNPNDEPASILLEKIREDKQKLIKEGIIKADKNDSFIYKNSDDNLFYEKIGNEIKCIDNEIPFDIPDNWIWCRLENIKNYIQRGKSPKYSDKKIYPVIAQKCNQWDGISLEKALFIDPVSFSTYKEERFLIQGDILINSTGTGTLGRIGFFTDDIKGNYSFVVADSHVTVLRCNKLVVSKYIYYFFISPHVQNEIESKASGSTNQIELYTNVINNYLIPLPPLMEQRKIVNYIEKILALIPNSIENI